jgi:competence protein ComEC
LDTLKKAMNETTFTLFASIFLGYKQLSKQITDITKNHFMTWGVTHYLARSGLHMIIFIFIWQFILAFLPLPWFFKELILILVGLTYGLLSWSSISFIRAFLTFLLYKWCNLLSKQINVLHLLATVCLIVLLANPIQLFFLDFQLSFGLTFALACFNQIQTDHKHQRYNHKIVASS